MEARTDQATAEVRPTPRMVVAALSDALPDGGPSLRRLVVEIIGGRYVMTRAYFDGVDEYEAFPLTVDDEGNISA